MGGTLDVTAQVTLAAVLIVLGLGLVVGAWFGRARSLIAVGSVVTVALVSVSTYSVPLRGGFGERFWTPQNPASVTSPYRLTGGSARLDLSQFDAQGATVPIEASVVFGELKVKVPDDTRVVVKARSGMGGVRYPDGNTDGVPAEREFTLPAPAQGDSKGTIELTLNVGMGEVAVDRVSA